MKTLELSCSLWWSPCGTSRLPYTQADLLTSSEVLHNEHHCRGLLLALADIEHNASVTVAKLRPETQEDWPKNESGQVKRPRRETPPLD